MQPQDNRPPFQLEGPVLDGALSPQEAQEIWALVKDEPGWVAMPPHLTEASRRLRLWQMPADPTLH